MTRLEKNKDRKKPTQSSTKKIKLTPEDWIRSLNEIMPESEKDREIVKTLTKNFLNSIGGEKSTVPVKNIAEGYMQRLLGFSTNDKYLFFEQNSIFGNMYYSPICFKFTELYDTEETVLVFDTSEELFMWLKARHFNDRETADKINKAIYPEDAKELGRSIRGYNDTSWVNCRTLYMKKVLTLKLKQHNHILNIAKYYAEKGLKFIYITSDDKIWGKQCPISIHDDNMSTDGERWKFTSENLLGGNLLGETLQEVINSFIGVN